jgi:hypothetical protein
MKPDVSAREQPQSAPEGYLVSLSPDEKWVVFWRGDQGAVVYAMTGGQIRPLCRCNAGPIFQDSPRVSWSGSGKLLVVNAGGSMFEMFVWVE